MKNILRKILLGSALITGVFATVNIANAYCVPGHYGPYGGWHPGYCSGGWGPGWGPGWRPGWGPGWGGGNCRWIPGWRGPYGYWHPGRRVCWVR